MMNTEQADEDRLDAISEHVEGVVFDWMVQTAKTDPNPEAVAALQVGVLGAAFRFALSTKADSVSVGYVGGAMTAILGNFVEQVEASEKAALQ